MKLWRTYRAFMFTLVSLAAISVLMEMRRLVRDLDVSVRMSDAVLRNANDASLDVVQVARGIKSLEDGEAKRIDASILEAQKTEASVRLLVIRTNESLNGGPHVQGLFPQVRASLAGIDSTVGVVRTELEPMLGNLQQATRSAADRLSDPAIGDTVEHLDAASAQLEATSRSMTGVAADAKLIADKVTQDYLKPQKFAWELLKQLAGLGGSFAQMIK